MIAIYDLVSVWRFESSEHEIDMIFSYDIKFFYGP